MWFPPHGANDHHTHTNTHWSVACCSLPTVLVDCFVLFRLLPATVCTVLKVTDANVWNCVECEAPPPVISAVAAGSGGGGGTHTHTSINQRQCDVGE